MQLSAADVRQRFAGTSLTDSPTDIVLPPGSRNWPDEMMAMLDEGLRAAGVLVPLMQRDELTVLLTRRSAALKHHAAQVSFPGGRIEPDDADIAATALRETREEVGIQQQHIDVAGYLPPMPTVTGYAVTPVVGLIAPDAELVIDRSEVEYAFEVPLAWLPSRMFCLPERAA